MKTKNINYYKLLRIKKSQAHPNHCDLCMFQDYQSLHKLTLLAYWPFPNHLRNSVLPQLSRLVVWEQGLFGIDFFFQFLLLFWYFWLILLLLLLLFAPNRHRLWFCRLWCLL